MCCWKEQISKSPSLWISKSWGKRRPPASLKVACCGCVSVCCCAYEVMKLFLFLTGGNGQQEQQDPVSHSASLIPPAAILSIGICPVCSCINGSGRSGLLPPACAQLGTHRTGGFPAIVGTRVSGDKGNVGGGVRSCSRPLCGGPRAGPAGQRAVGSLCECTARNNVCTISRCLKV